MTWAWTSRPSTISHVPVMAFDVDRSLFQFPRSQLPGRAVKLAARSTARRDAQQGRFVEGAADQLQAQRQAVGRSSPAGTEMPGRPARLTGTVKTSFRYMAIGSSVFSPMAKAADGVVGVRITSTFLKASVKSRRISAAQPLRLQVIGVVIAGRQHIGADQDAALHLGAEAVGAGVLIHLVQRRRPARAGRSARRHSAPGWTRPRPAR